MIQTKIVIIGAGSVVFTQGLVADMIVAGGDWDVHLVDTNAENLGVAQRVVERMVAMRQAPVTVSATMDRHSSLPGADVVVCTFGVGGRRGWEQDVFIPRRFGIFQPVGDSILPGGLSRALRHVPLGVLIAQDMADLCPDALLISYANPMTAIVRGMRRTTGVPAIGLCHGVNHVQAYLAELAGVSQAETSLTAIGVNHCTWITEFRHQGVDAWPLAKQGLAADPSALPGPDQPFARTGVFSWDLFDVYGAFPAVMDRHVVEFFPALCQEFGYYGRTLGVDAFSFEGTIAAGDVGFAHMAAVAAGDEPIDSSIFAHTPGEHEQLITILQCLAGESSGIFSANLPNVGRVPGVPRDAILEGMALIDENGVRTLDVGEIAPTLRHQIAHRSLIAELTVDAALSGDLDLVVQTILLEGALTIPDEARALARALIEAHAEYLPQFRHVI